MRPNVLVITPHFHKDLRQATHLLTAIVRAKSLALAGCNVYVVLPSTRIVNTYKPEELKNWHPDLIPVQVDMVNDQSMGALTHGKALLKLLNLRGTPIPYDAVLNFNTAASVGLQRQLCDNGFSQVNVPVITWLDIAASYDEWKRRPSANQEWYKYWEVLEAISPLAGRTIIDNPYDYGLVKRQMRRILSPAYFRQLEKRFSLVWGSVPPVVPLYRHERPKKGEPFLLFIPGAFGKGWEQFGHQAEIAIEAMKKLHAMGDNVKLVVSTNTKAHDWIDERLKGTEDFIRVVRFPPHETYQKLYKRVHIGLNYRYMLDGLNLSWIEMMESGKPVIWRKSKWLAPVIPDRKTSLMVDSNRVEDLVAMIRYAMQNYEAVSDEAYDLGITISQRHASMNWGSEVRRIIRDAIEEFNPDFEKRNFKSLSPAFEKVNDLIGEEFNIAYKILNKDVNGAFSFYSRILVLKLLRRCGIDTKAEDGKLKLVKLEES